MNQKITNNPQSPTRRLQSVFARAGVVASLVFVVLLPAVSTAQETATQETAAAKDVGGSASVDDFIRTCLLYTSPSPRDATLSRMPSSA